MRAEINFLEGITAEFIDTHRFKNTFKRLWGTTTVDGVDVFNEKFYIYPNTGSENVQKFAKLLGISDDINSARFEGVSSVWFVIDPKKVDGSYYDDITGELVEQKLDTLFVLNQEYSVSLNSVIIEGSDPAFDQMTSAERLGYLQTNYSDIVTNSSRFVEVHGDIELGEVDTQGNEIHQFSKYVIQSSASNFDITLDRVEISSVEKLRYPVASGYGEYGSEPIPYLEYTLACLFTIKRTAPTPDNSDVTALLLAEEDEYQKQRIAEAARLNRDTEGFLTYNGPVKTTNSLFYEDLLRESLTNSSNLKSVDFKRTVTRGLKIRYAKKKTKWYKKIIAIVIVVVVVWLSSGTLGATAGAITSAQAATFFTTVAVSLAATSYALGAAGLTQIATYTSKFTKAFSFAATFTGIMALINSAVTRLTATAAQRLTSQAATDAVSTVAADTVTDVAIDKVVNISVEATLSDVTLGDVTKTVTDYISGATSNISFNNVIKIADQISGLYRKNELAEIQNANNELQRQKERQEEELFTMNEQEFKFGLITSQEYSRNLYQPLDRIEQSYNIDWRYAEKGHNIA